MSVKITDNTIQWKLKASRATNLAIRMALDDMDRIAKPNTPHDKGNLSRDVLKTVGNGKGKIQWRKVYAQVQERGVIRGSKIRHYTTPGTGPHFAENAAKEVDRKGAGYYLSKAGLK